MKNIYEPARELPVIEEVDVLVAGGGPAGVSAAVGASRAGARTMIIERLGSFGGMWTNGLVITLAGYNNWLRPYQRCVNGVVGEWLRKAAELGGAEDNQSWVLNSDPEVMKLIADQLVLENNIHPLLHTWIVDVILEDREAIGVVIENVNGRSAVLAKRIIDCTGNGDVLARAGAGFWISKDLQPMTLPFFINRVRPDAEVSHESEVLIPVGPEPGFLEEPHLSAYASRRHDIVIDGDKLRWARENDQFPRYGGPWFGGLRKNQVWVNTTRVYGSAVDAEDLTAAEMEARRDANEIMAFYRREFPIFEEAYLAQSSPVIGIRETRRLEGVYTLTGEDLRGRKNFPDSIAIGVWPIDVHPAQGEVGIHTMYVPGPYQIPYRCLLPTNLENVLASGRCISSDREAHGSVRVGATCGAVGHAAGVAAAASVQQDSSLREVDYQALRERLLDQNAVLDPPGD